MKIFQRIINYFSRETEASEGVNGNRNNPTRKPYEKKQRRANNPPTPYSLFLMERRNTILEKVDFKTFVRESSQQWKQMTEESRAEYRLKAHQIKIQMRDVYGTAKRRGKKKKGSKRKLCPYWKYANQVRPQVVQNLKDNGENRPQMVKVNIIIAKKWHALSPEEKNKYK